MEYSPLDPAEAVVLFDDLQAGILELSRTIEVSRLLRCVSALAKLASLCGMPAVTLARSPNINARRRTRSRTQPRARRSRRPAGRCC